MSAKRKNDQEKRFEELLGELEKVVHSLENEEPDLELALERYERGTQLAAELKKRLDEAERKVLLLKKNKGGAVEAVPFEGGKEKGS